jgi:hypothetical protein
VGRNGSCEPKKGSNVQAPKKGRPARAHAEKSEKQTHWKRYQNRMRRFAYDSLAQHAQRTGRPLDADLLELARTAGGRVSLRRSLRLAGAARLGLDWQRFDAEFWASQGLEAENFGNSPMHDGADGVVDGVRLQYKIARTTLGRTGSRAKAAFFAVNDLAPLGSGVKNVILFVDDLLPPKDWRLFYGTTEELFDTAMAVRARPGQLGFKRLPPLGAGSWMPQVHHIHTLWGGSAAEMTLSSYVAARFERVAEVADCRQDAAAR